MTQCTKMSELVSDFRRQFLSDYYPCVPWFHLPTPMSLYVPCRNHWLRIISSGSWLRSQDTKAPYFIALKFILNSRNFITPQKAMSIFLIRCSVQFQQKGGRSQNFYAATHNSGKQNHQKLVLAWPYMVRNDIAKKLMGLIRGLCNGHPYQRQFAFIPRYRFQLIHYFDTRILIYQNHE